MSFVKNYLIELQSGIGREYWTHSISDFKNYLIPYTIPFGCIDNYVYIFYLVFK